MSAVLKSPERDSQAFEQGATIGRAGGEDEPGRAKAGGVHGHSMSGSRCGADRRRLLPCCCLAASRGIV